MVSRDDVVRLQLRGPPKSVHAQTCTVAGRCVRALRHVAVAALAQQPARFEDVVRNLRNPGSEDSHQRGAPAARSGISRSDRAAGARWSPIRSNEIQLEAIDAELSFFLVEPVPAKKRVALVVEVRDRGPCAGRVRAGAAGACGPKPVPAELVDALLQAVDDENASVRVEAIYALGVDRVGRRIAAVGSSRRPLIKALDHYDPAVRAGAARVVGRLEVKSAGDALIKAVNDSSADVRYAAMRALGEIREERAVQALTEQLNYYGKGEGAVVRARRAGAHRAPVERRRRSSAARRQGSVHAPRGGRRAWPRRRRHVGRRRSSARSTRTSPTMARAAMAFALYKKGRRHLPRRLVDFLDSDELAPQIQDYLLELGPLRSPLARRRLQEPDATSARNLVTVLGAIGDQSTVAALEALQRGSDREVAARPTYAIERIKMTPR